MSELFNFLTGTFKLATVMQAQYLLARSDVRSGSSEPSGRPKAKPPPSGGGKPKARRGGSLYKHFKGKP
ncbi:hypothetical protein [Orrella dioscoreae]|uniref:hypothetical protein n=1 Tax=Orrella dioscoreae TaxID=1851544 RepID=UPI0012FFFB99|nr:hypothetical protein [Orrella dioscoreae]